MGAFFLTMALYPAVQKKAQEELDAVVGSERLPGLSDRPSLPYVNALIKELFRWHPVSIIGLPHRVVDDDEYNGYFIPSGASVFVNMWYVHVSLSESRLRLIPVSGESCTTPKFTLNLKISSRNAFSILLGIWTSEGGTLLMSFLALAVGKLQFRSLHHTHAHLVVKWTFVSRLEHVLAGILPSLLSSPCAPLSSPPLTLDPLSAKMALPWMSCGKRQTTASSRECSSHFPVTFPYMMNWNIFTGI